MANLPICENDEAGVSEFSGKEENSTGSILTGPQSDNDLISWVAWHRLSDEQVNWFQPIQLVLF